MLHSSSAFPILRALRVAEVANAHLCRHDLELIMADGTIGVACRGAFGALLYLPSDGDFAMHIAAGFSHAAIHVLQLALDQGFTHVRFDADAAPTAGLAMFQW